MGEEIVVREVGGRCSLGLLLRHIGADLVIDLQKCLRVPPVQRQAQDSVDVTDDRIREECHVVALDPVGNALAVEEIDDRQGAFIIPVKDGRIRRFSRCNVADHFRHGPPALEGKLHDVAALLPVRIHRLWVPLLALLDEAVRQAYDGAPAPVIRLDVQDLGLGIGLPKAVEFLRAGCAEAVDRLVLVANHEEVSGISDQKTDQAVLDQRRVLRLVNADVFVFFFIII